MAREDFEQIESSQRQHFDVLEHESKMYTLGIAERLAFVSALHPTITKDGTKWCVLYGNDLQEGIAGFGDTVMQAVDDFNSAMNKKATQGDHDGKD